MFLKLKRKVSKQANKQSTWCQSRLKDNIANTELTVATGKS